MLTSSAFDTKIPGVVESASDELAQVRFDGGCAQVVGDFLIGEQLFLCLRPEDITLSLPGAKSLQSSQRNEFRCTARKVTPRGAYYRVALACGENRLVALITRPLFLELKIAEGDTVVASFKASAVHVIKRN